MDYFDKNFNQDICSFANNLINDKLKCEDLFLGTLNYGFKAVSTRYFELLRYLGFLKSKSVNNFDFINSAEFGEISKIKILKNIFRFNFEKYY